MELPQITEELKQQTDNLEIKIVGAGCTYDAMDSIIGYGLNAVAESYFFNRMSQLTKGGVSEEDIIKQLGIIVCPIDWNFGVKGEFLFNLKRIERDIYVPNRAYNRSMLRLPGIEVFRSIQPFDWDEGNCAGMERWWNSKRREKLHRLMQGRDSLTDTHLHKDGLWYAGNLWNSSLRDYRKYANLAEDSTERPIPEAFVGLELTKYYSEIVRVLTNK
jgi:hypothetical protein